MPLSPNSSPQLFRQNKCSVPLQFHVEILLGVGVIPSNDHNIVICFLFPYVAVGIGIVVIVFRTAL